MSSVPVSSDCVSSFGRGRARPKSRSFTPWGVRKTFEGLRSRWTMPVAWRAPSADSMPRPRAIASGDRHRPARESRARQGLTLEQLHGDEQLAAVLPDLVHLADVRVVDAGRGPGLAAEPLAGRLVGLGDRLDRDPPPQALVLGREDDAHAALAEPVEDAVAPQPPRRLGCRGRRASPRAVPSIRRRSTPLREVPPVERRRAGLGFLVLVHRGKRSREYTRLSGLRAGRREEVGDGRELPPPLLLRAVVLEVHEPGHLVERA